MNIEQIDTTRIFMLCTDFDIRSLQVYVNQFKISCTTDESKVSAARSIEKGGEVKAKITLCLDTDMTWKKSEEVK